MKINQKKFTQFTEVFDMSLEQKKELGIITQKEQCVYLKITAPTYNSYRERILKIRKDTAPDDITAYTDRMRILAMTAQGTSIDRQNYGRMLGVFTDKREDTLRVEFTPTDRIRQARELRDELRRELDESGSCPLCGFSKVLRHEVCLDTESEHSEDREVAALGLSTGLN